MTLTTSPKRMSSRAETSRRFCMSAELSSLAAAASGGRAAAALSVAFAFGGSAAAFGGSTVAFGGSAFFLDSLDHSGMSRPPYVLHRAHLNTTNMRGMRSKLPNPAAREILNLRQQHVGP